jgi:GNAT superfamily N-acetyltransferase
MNTNIRQALPEEADVLSHIAFSAKAYWGYPEKWLGIWKPQLTFPLEYFEENESWVIEADNKPIAFYTLQQKNSNAWIDNLWVLPTYSGMGIGKGLFLHALSRSRLKGHLVLQLEADPNTLGFYGKMGMYQIGEQHYEVEGQPRILPIMEIKL